MSNRANKRNLEEEPAINNDVKVTKKSKKNNIPSSEPLPEDENPLPEPLPEPEKDSSSEEDDDSLDPNGTEDGEENKDENKDKNSLYKPIPKRTLVKNEKEENSYVLNPDHIDMLKKIDYNSVLRFRHKIESVSIRRRLEMFNYIRSDMRPVITDLLQINYSHVKDEADWINWSDENIFERLLEVLPKSSENGAVTIEERLYLLKCDFNAQDYGLATDYVAAFRAEMKMWEKAFIGSSEEKKNSLRMIISNIIKKGKSKNKEKSYSYQLAVKLESKKYEEVQAFTSELLRKAREMNKFINEAMSCGLVEQYPEQKGKKPFKKDFPTDGNKPVKSNKSCWGCGRDTHTKDECKLKLHPDFNRGKGPWISSENGKAWAERVDESGNKIITLPFTKTLSGETFSVHSKKESKKSFVKRKELLNIIQNKNIKITSPFIYVNALFNDIYYKFIMILDTGAIQANYLSKRWVDKLDIEGFKIKNDLTIISADSSKIDYFGTITLYNIVFKKLFLKLNNKFLKQISIDKLDFRIINSEIDMIIGLPTIKKYKLVTEVFKEIFEDEELEEVILGRTIYTMLLSISLQADRTEVLMNRWMWSTKRRARILQL